MLTIEKLREYGANVNEGLERCMNNTDFYLMLVNKSLAGNQIQQLEEAVNGGDLQRAFEIAHALKGVYGNLSLTPLFNAVVVITEDLRNKVMKDYGPQLEEIKNLYQSLLDLAK